MHGEVKGEGDVRAGAKFRINFGMSKLVLVGYEKGGFGLS